MTKDPHKKRQKQIRMSDDLRQRFDAAQKESGMTADAFVEYLLDQAQGAPLTNSQLITMLSDRLMGDGGE